jgi:hypothetical protein
VGDARALENDPRTCAGSQPPKTAESIVFAIPEHFFDLRPVPHRMACAKCSFYLPQGSSQLQLLQGKTNLLQLCPEIPLNDWELAAVDDGVAAMEKLLEQLADVPTPARPTLRDLGNRVCDDKG